MNQILKTIHVVFSEFLVAATKNTVVKNALTRWRAEQKIRASIRELQMFNDSELSELGIARVDIADVVRMRGDYSADKYVSTNSSEMPKTLNNIVNTLPLAA